MADGSKTEKATPKKRRDERKKGNIFLSQDAVSVATLLTSACLLIAMADGIAARLGEFIVFCVRSCARPTGTAGDAWMEIGRQAGVVLVKTALPLLAVTALCAIAVTFAQTRLLVSGELLKPKFNRINPLQGIKRLFSLKSVVDAFKGILKITLLMIIIFGSLRDRFLESSKYLYTDLDMACRHIFESGKSMVLRIVLAFAVVAALDYFYQWWDYERQLRMSKQEIKEEYKQTEGDPQIKGKIKENQRKMAQRRMMQQVPKADVVIRNPTHFAVALRYDPDRDNAPIVLAKGQDELALRIVRVAEENKVEVVENVPLARAIYASAELDRQIPPELYGAVADVLVYVFRLNNRDLAQELGGAGHGGDRPPDRR